MKEPVDSGRRPLLLSAAAILAATSWMAAAQSVTSVKNFAVRPGTAGAATALEGATGLATLERYCQGTLCVVLPATSAEQTALSAIEARGLVSLEALPDARKIFFAKATYDADTNSFATDFPGRNEFDTVSAMSQWTLIFKAFPEPAWRNQIEAAGFHFGESMGPMAVQLYGPRDSLAGLRARAPYIAAIAEVPHGIKRFDLDVLRAGDEAGGPASTTVVIFNVPESPARAALTAKAGHEPPVVYATGATIAYHAILTKDEGLYLSTFPDVIAVARETAEAVPSDERSNAIIAGNPQAPPTSWPLFLGINSNPPFWNHYLTFLSMLGINPANQTIAFLDTGLNAGPMNTCPPALVDPSSGACSLLNPASLTDITTYFSNPALRATDYLGHGTLTTSLAAGFAASTGGRDSEGYSYVQGIAPGAKIALSKFLEYRQCAPSSPLETFRTDFVNEGALFSGTDTSLRYSLVELSQPTTTYLPDGVRGANAAIYNHSWNYLDNVDYGTTDILFDQSARTLQAIQFDFSTNGTANVYHGGNGPATHVVSAGNTTARTQTVTSPGLAKNVVTVGSTETYNLLSYPAFPTGCPGGTAAEADNPRQLSVLSRYGFPNLRLKPDFVAPGTRIYAPQSAAYNHNCVSAENCNSLAQAGTPAYYLSAGTSYSAPIGAGVVALLREWLHNSFGLAPPSPALTRATLAIGAHNLVNSWSAGGTCCNEAGQCWSCGDMRPAPDRYQGWGGIALDQYFGFVSNYYFVDQSQPPLTQGQTWTKTLTINNTSQPVRIALVWTDRAAPATLYGYVNLQNDLDLKVQATGSDHVTHTWYGNLFYLDRNDPNRNEFSLRDPSSVIYDRKNNQEKIAIARTGQPNGWPSGALTMTITVTGFSIGYDGIDPAGNTPRQDFALAVENAH